MSLRKIPGRVFWGFLGITALAQPVCAAICPRGRGFCPYPGKCFLYVDADSNSLCDYTRTAVSTPGPTATVCCAYSCSSFGHCHFDSANRHTRNSHPCNSFSCGHPHTTRHSPQQYKLLPFHQSLSHPLTRVLFQQGIHLPCNQR